jgi:hypothetical protein
MTHDSIIARVFQFFIKKSYKNVKVKQVLYRTGQALRVPGDRGSQISRQSAH